MQPLRRGAIHPFVMTIELEPRLLTGPGLNDDIELLKCLGARLKSARARRNLTTKELARQAGIDHAWIVAMERGDPNVTLVGFLRVLTFAGLTDDIEPGLDDSRRDGEPLSMSTPSVKRNRRAGSPANARCSKFRSGHCQDVFVYQAFRTLFGD